MENIPSANMFYSSLVNDHRATGIATESDAITKVDVGSKDLYAFEQDLTEVDGNFDKKAGASFDSVFSPYSTSFSDTGLATFEVPTNKTEPNSLTLNPFNPNNALSLYYAPTGSQLYQASLATSGSPTSAEQLFSTVDSVTKVGTGIRLDNRQGLPSGWLEFGHNIEFAIKGTGESRFADFNDEYASYSG